MIIEALTKAIDTAAAHGELSEFVGDHLTRDDDGITLSYQDPNGNGYDRAFLRLEKDGAAIGFGNEFKACRIEISADNAYFIAPNGERIALTDLLIAVKLLLRRSID